MCTAVTSCACPNVCKPPKCTFRAAYAYVLYSTVCKEKDQVCHCLETCAAMRTASIETQQIMSCSDLHRRHDAPEDKSFPHTPPRLHPHRGRSTCFDAAREETAGLRTALHGDAMKGCKELNPVAYECRRGYIYPKQMNSYNSSRMARHAPSDRAHDHQILHGQESQSTCTSMTPAACTLLCTAAHAYHL